MLKNIIKCHKVKIQQFIAKHFKFIVYHTEKYPITRVISVADTSDLVWLAKKWKA